MPGPEVAVKARAPFFEKGSDDDHPAFTRQLRHRVRARPGNLLRELEVFVVLHLAEVLRGEELLQADDLRAAIGGFAHLGQGLGEIFLPLHGAAHLDESESDFGRRHAKREKDASRYAQAKRSCVKSV